MLPIYSLTSRVTGRLFIVALVTSLAWCAALNAQTTRPAFRPRGMRSSGLTNQADAWFQTDAGKLAVDHVLNWQNADGGWWKDYNLATTRPAVVADRTNSGPAGDDDPVWHSVSTIDNNATYSDLRILARAYRVLKDDRYKDGFIRGMHYLFAAQYLNGGWPQRFPLQDNYGRHITFNDGAMLGVMRLLKDVVDGKPDFIFVSKDDQERSRRAFAKGIECILNCQITVHGTLTVWCQQHNEITLEPASARNYELPCLTASESSGLVALLMDIEKPDARVRRSIEAAVVWFDSAKITGKRYGMVQNPTTQSGRDRLLIDDPSAAPIWARFYDIETNEPIFSSRDGIERDRLEDISYERRNGYAWFGTSGSRVAADYLAWKKRVGVDEK